MHESQIQQVATLLEQEKHDEALRLANTLLNEEHDEPRLLFMVGSVFLRAERFGLAYNVFRRVMEIAPHRAEAWNNAGMAALGCHDMGEAQRLLRRALKLDPKNTAAMNNLGLLYLQHGEVQRAVSYCNASLALDGNQPEPKETLGYANLMLGNWQEGWAGFDSMIGHSKHRKEMSYNGEPRWKGETKGRLILRGEQGIGDEISFASMIPDASCDNEITLDCDKRLEGLFKRSFPYIEVRGTRFERDHSWVNGIRWDYHALLGSLGAIYRPSDYHFPGTPYLVADQERCVQWRALLDTLPGMKVGIAWTGGLPNTFRHRRSFPLESLLPILKTEGVSWVSLQYDDPTEEIEAFEEKHGIKIHHWPRAAEAYDYDETAALVSELDLVITTTTSVVHLSGALGVPAWVMVPKLPRWFYRLEGDGTPWYRSVRLYRQSDKWPVEQIAADLRKELNGE
jgi:thioredoxin-like negative regulator of GroEL